MRVSTQQVFLQGIARLSDLNAQTQRAQEEIATGRSVLSAADDPVAASRALQFEGQLSQLDQYQRNMDLAENRLNVIESDLTSLQDIVFRLQELLVQANNGALTNDERQAIAFEIDERLAEMADLTNARDSEGNYIFGGFITDVQPFEQVADGFQYRGDDGVRLLQISATSNVAISVSGKELFNDIAVSGNIARGSALDTNLSAIEVRSVNVVDQQLFDDVFPEDFVVSFNPLDNVVPAGANYTITRRSDGAIISSDQTYDAAAGIDFNGLTVQLTGTPSQGDQFVIESARSQDMLTTVQDIANRIASFADVDERQAYFEAADENLDNILESLSIGRSRIGARLNVLESTRNANEATQLNTQEVLSDIRDLDYTEAISNLTFTSFVLEASQQSFVRISGLSLFNFIR